MLPRAPLPAVEPAARPRLVTVPYCNLDRARSPKDDFNSSAASGAWIWKKWNARLAVSLVCLLLSSHLPCIFEDWDYPQSFLHSSLVFGVCLVFFPVRVFPHNQRAPLNRLSFL